MPKEERSSQLQKLLTELRNKDQAVDDATLELLANASAPRLQVALEALERGDDPKHIVDRLRRGSRVEVVDVDDAGSSATAPSDSNSKAIAPGESVMLHGLKRLGHLNGKVVTVVESHPDGGKVRAKFHDGTLIDVRRSCCHPVHPEVGKANQAWRSSDSMSESISSDDEVSVLVVPAEEEEAPPIAKFVLEKGKIAVYTGKNLSVFNRFVSFVTYDPVLHAIATDRFSSPSDADAIEVPLRHEEAVLQGLQELCSIAKVPISHGTAEDEGIALGETVVLYGLRKLERYNGHVATVIQILPMGKVLAVLDDGTQIRMKQSNWKLLRDGISDISTPKGSVYSDRTRDDFESARKAPHGLTPGDVVILYGLRDEERHNGERATVNKVLPDGKVLVTLDNGTQLRVRENNTKPLAGGDARHVGGAPRESLLLKSYERAVKLVVEEDKLAVYTGRRCDVFDRFVTYVTYDPITRLLATDSFSSVTDPDAIQVPFESTDYYLQHIVSWCTRLGIPHNIGQHGAPTQSPPLPPRAPPAPPPPAPATSSSTHSSPSSKALQTDPAPCSRSHRIHSPVLNLSVPRLTAVSASPETTRDLEHTIPKTAEPEEDEEKLLHATLERPDSGAKGMLGFQLDANLLVTKVEPNSPAAWGGVTRGMKVVTLAGRRVQNLSDVRAVLESCLGAVKITLELPSFPRPRANTAASTSTSSSSTTTTSTTSSSSSSTSSSPPPRPPRTPPQSPPPLPRRSPPTPPTPSPCIPDRTVRVRCTEHPRRLGMALSDSLMVLKVHPDGPASRGGVKEGEYLRCVAGRDVYDLPSVRRAVERSPDDTIELVLSVEPVAFPTTSPAGGRGPGGLSIAPTSPLPRDLSPPNRPILTPRSPRDPPPPLNSPVFNVTVAPGTMKPLLSPARPGRQGTPDHTARSTPPSTSLSYSSTPLMRGMVWQVT